MKSSESNGRELVVNNARIFDGSAYFQDHTMSELRAAESVPSAVRRFQEVDKLMREGDFSCRAS
jgi:hypothetical protein